MRECGTNSQYFYSFCSQSEAASDVIYVKYVTWSIVNKAAKFGTPELDRPPPKFDP